VKKGALPRAVSGDDSVTPFRKPPKGKAVVAAFPFMFFGG
jgi:hypothetical protein